MLDRSLYRRFEAPHRASQGAEDLLERESRTLLFLRELFTRHTAAPAGSRRLHDPRTVSRVRQSLHDRFSENIRISELAAESGVSETQVIRSFSAATGLAPHAYLIAPRVERAKHFIRLGMPLVEVTALAGFPDQSHLTRHFKRITSITPGAFARMAGRRQGTFKTPLAKGRQREHMNLPLPSRLIPLSSDTESKPTPAMRQAVASAEVGDEQHGEDPTVNLLQERVAALLGKEAALWFPGGRCATSSPSRSTPGQRTRSSRTGWPTSSGRNREALPSALTCWWKGFRRSEASSPRTNCGRPWRA
nr:AraC family transcriptional regulator [Corallococcus sp. NCSPR001]